MSSKTLYRSKRTSSGRRKMRDQNMPRVKTERLPRVVLDNIIENFDIADNENVPICQDTGMACVFLEIGQDVHFVGGDLTDAINEGVRRGYTKDILRKSVVKDPVRRGNTGDNTPAMIYTEIVPGEQIKITVGPKASEVKI